MQARCSRIRPSPAFSEAPSDTLNHDLHSRRAVGLWGGGRAQAGSGPGAADVPVAIASWSADGTLLQQAELATLELHMLAYFMCTQGSSGGTRWHRRRSKCAAVAGRQCCKTARQQRAGCSAACVHRCTGWIGPWRHTYTTATFFKRTCFSNKTRARCRPLASGASQQCWAALQPIQGSRDFAYHCCSFDRRSDRATEAPQQQPKLWRPEPGPAASRAACMGSLTRP